MRRASDVFIIFVLVFSCISFGFAQVTNQTEDVTSGQPASDEVSSSVIIRLIEVKGNKSISTNTITSKMKSKMNDPYQENVASDDLKRLYLLGYFEDIKFDTESYKNGIKLIVTVRERPIIEKITLSGITRLTAKDEKIISGLKSKEGQYLDYPTLDEDVLTIKKMYEKIGYSEVQISYQVNLDKATNKAKCQFNVVEGLRVKVRKIIIEANKAFSDSRILKLLKTKSAWLFNSGVYKEDVMAEDIERIKGFYQKAGFADIGASYSLETKADRKNRMFLFITIKIEEGKKYLTGNISIEGNKDIPEKVLLARLKNCIPGKVFSEEGMKEDITSVQGQYFDKGYIFAQVQESTSVNDQTNRVDIAYNVTENQVAYVDKIKLRGNVKTRDIVIRRELRIRPGDRFDGDKLKRSKERLTNLGFFEDVSYDVGEEKGQPADKRNLVVDVKESKTGAFSFGGGYSTVDQFVGFVEIEQKNFDWKNFPYFTGGGQDLKLRAAFGTISSGYDLSFTNPWIFDYPVAFGFDAYRRVHNRDTDVGYGYDEKITGGDLRLAREITEHVKADISYRYDQINISNISDNASDDLKSEYGKKSISSVTPGLTFDTRDNVFEPTKGNLLTGTFECAGGPFGANKNYVKFFGRASHYIPLFRGSTLELRARAGLADPYSDTEKIPIYERFFAGGASTIRGYQERKIGPVDPSSKDPLGGESLLVGNIEYLYPLFSFMKVAAFYDVGNVWEKMSKFGFHDLKSGIGLGVRLKTPIGPIMLDYGIPLDKESGEDKKGNGRFHFSASHGF